MKNNLSSLNNYLFEELERLNDTEELANVDAMEREIKRSKAIANISQTIINNASIILNAIKIKEEYGIENDKNIIDFIGTNEK